jgi:hypothetical protein
MTICPESDDEEVRAAEEISRRVFMHREFEDNGDGAALHVELLFDLSE